MTKNQNIQCDYRYGLSQAISDGVCRMPRLTIVDNNRILLRKGPDTQCFGAFKDLLEQSDCRYQQLLESQELILHVLREANNKLNLLRTFAPDAGGLIVAASVAHAQRIATLLSTELGEEALIATYLEDDALSIIHNFKTSNDKWIISVGMISEGTNLPRLRVCCHLTRVKTELYFRQVLGRILRANGSSNEEGFFYMPAEPTLVEYAYRLSEDIPKESVTYLDTMTTTSCVDWESNYLVVHAVN